MKPFAVVIASSLILMMAVSPSGASPPDFPVPTITRTDTIHGDLILAGTDSLMVEHTRLVVKGNIYLFGAARLRFLHSIVTVLHYPREEIFLSDSASLYADTTVFDSFLHCYAHGSGSVEFTNVFLINLLELAGRTRATVRDSWIFREPFGLIQVGDQAQVHVERCVVGAVGLSFPSTVTVVIDSLRPGFFTRWSAREVISAGLPYDLVLEDTEIKENTGYSGGYEMGWNVFVPSDITMTMTASILNKLVITFRNENVHVSNLVIRTPTNFQRGAIDIRQTTVHAQWGIFVAHGETVVEDSRGVWLWPEGAENTTVVNTALNEFDPRNYTGTITLMNCSMTNGFEVFENSHVRLEGSVRMLQISPLFTQNSSITRTFDLVLCDAVSGAGMGGIDLELGKDGVLVWAGTTAADGRVAFEVTFDYGNHLDSWTLQSADPAVRLERNISIMTSSPHFVGLEWNEEGAWYRPVVYVDPVAGEPATGLASSPYSTIGEALRESSGPTIIRAAAGTYREDVAMKSHLTLEGAGADSTVIDGELFLWSVDSAEVRSLSIAGDTLAGIHCYSSTLMLRNVAVSGQEHNGLHVQGSTLSLVNCVTGGNGANGLWLERGSMAHLRNSILTHNGSFGVFADDSSLAILEYSDLWGNPSGGYGGSVEAGPTNLAADPMLQSLPARDFHLLGASPCIDAGDPDSEFNDRDGTRNDMGVFGGPLARTPSVVAVRSSLPQGSPDRYRLYQNTPNPFNSLTTIRYDLPRRSRVQLTVFDLTGREVASLVDGIQEAGMWLIRFDAGRLSSGLYLYRMTAGAYRQTFKMLLLR